MRTMTFLIRKEFIHIFRDPRTMLILLVMPVVLVVLFGFAITTEVKDTRVAVVDMAMTPLSRRVTLAFEGNPNFSVTHACASQAQLDPLFKRGEIDMALCFSEDFGAKEGGSVQMLFDALEPNQASLRSNYAAQLFAQTVAQQGARADAPTVRVNTRMLHNPQLKSEYNFVPGVIGMIIILLCTLMTSISIVREKETTTMQMLIISPVRPAYIVAAKLVPYFSIACSGLLTTLLLSKHMLGIPMAGSVAALLGVSLVYILTCLALGMLISTLTSTQLVAMLLSILMIIPTLYFSGMVFPIESMPTAVQKVSAIVPARWYIDAARKLMIQGVEASYVAKDAAVLTIEFLVLMAISLKNFSRISK